MEERKIEVQRKIRESTQILFSDFIRFRVSPDFLLLFQGRRRKTLPPVEYKLYVPPHLRGKPAEDAQTKEAADRVDFTAILW